jgi:hypothetical protein
MISTIVVIQRPDHRTGFLMASAMASRNTMSCRGLSDSVSIGTVSAITAQRSRSAVTTASTTADSRPKEDDITACLDCGNVMAFRKDLTLRELTDEERKGVEGSATIQRLLAIRRAFKPLRH